ncbi:hypothetical protein [Domibacillus aminovorans]|uniref:hypothetical protein n=1 Tax=Domibacillus aminovorans TaxID=29332 RepID=UPI0014709A01|nr:hypothetical protein [Domibacillus aminovorans]
MNRHEVFKTLKRYHALTGKVMTSEQMILAVGNTSPVELIRGIRMFDKYLDLQRGGAA